MGYTTDLSILKTAYGFDDNIRVGCPALWMADYFDLSDPIEALAMGTLDPNKKDTRGFGMEILCFRGSCFTRGMMFPTIGSDGGLPAVGHSSTYGFLGYKDNVDSYFQKECTLNTGSIKTANLINLYIKRNTNGAGYTANIRINLPKDSSHWYYSSNASTDVTMYEVILKFPKSVYSAASFPAFKIGFSKTNCLFVSLDSTNGYIHGSKYVSSTNGLFSVLRDAYDYLTACANRGLPVGVRIDAYY